MQSMNYSNFRTGAILTFIIAVTILTWSYITGHNQSFLLLNHDFGKTADFFFKYWTNVGNGILWVPLLAVFLLFRKKYIPLLIAGFVFSTLFTHLFKDFILPNEPRPANTATGITAMHTVEGVELYKLSSFPSGHTATAFCFFLIGCLLIDKKWFLPVGFVLALLVGYSRIYLAEHFPGDVGGGMIAALLTMAPSIIIQQRIDKKQSKKVV